MPVKASDYANNSVFVVLISNTELSFSKISGIGSSVEYDTYVEGGGRTHLFAKPKTAAGTITFEKGVSVIDKSTAPILSPGCMVNDVEIALVKNGHIVERYCIDSGMVVSWQLGELDALSTGVAIKSFQLAHSGLIIG